MAKSQTQLRESENKEKKQLIIPPPMMSDNLKPTIPTHLRKNDRNVLETLLQVSDITRSELVKLCDLPRTTIYDSLVRLERLGIVERYFEERTTRGRPKTYYRCT
jgi:uncharacterized membrane protein